MSVAGPSKPNFVAGPSSEVVEFAAIIVTAIPKIMPPHDMLEQGVVIFLDIQINHNHHNVAFMMVQILILDSTTCLGKQHSHLLSFQSYSVFRE